MIIIGFTHKTSKILPRIFCRKLRHCAVIVPQCNGYILYQFVKHGHIVPIQLRFGDLSILAKYGWQFIELPGTTVPGFETCGATTCVDMTKSAIGMRAFWIQTPYALYHYICKKYAR